jgi:HAE1 family hydrophobic/amphiphilic exporter-1
MNILGFTINVMTLMGLSLAVGILIDDAIVVMENVYRHLSMGKEKVRAAIDGTKEIGLAVMATTFAIMVVFLPVAYMEGLVGRFFYEFGITVAFSVLISLFVAFTLTPMMSSRWLTIKNNGDNESNRNQGLFLSIWNPIYRFLSLWNKTFEKFNPKYIKLLRSSLNHRWLVILFASLTVVFAWFMTRFVGMEFMTESDQNQMSITMSSPPGTNLHETVKKLQELESIARGLIEVKNTFITIGEGNAPVNDGSLLVKFVDRSERLLTAKQLVDSTRILFSDIPGAIISVATQKGEGGGEKPIELSIRGADLEVLTQLSHKIQEIMYDIPGTVDIDNSLDEGKPEIKVDVDRRLADDLALNLYNIPATVRSMIEGEVVSTFKDGYEEYDVRVKLDEKFRSSMASLEQILIKSEKDLPNGDKMLVPLGRVAKLQKSSSIGQYNRFDRQREVRVNANVASWTFAGTVSGTIMEEVSLIDLPPGYSVNLVGEQEMMVESFTNIMKALLLAVIFIYLLLASQYESFFDPLSIMISLPLSLVGAILGLVGSSFSIMSLIGIVLLMGLVTKNAILLIDFVKQERTRGVSRTEAILKAGPTRLRPILMTTLATVFGMLPLALGLGPGAEFRSPMAKAVIGGMLSSTLLTLVVVPVVYTLIDDFVGFFKKNKIEEIKTEETVVSG